MSYEMAVAMKSLRDDLEHAQDIAKKLQEENGVLREKLSLAEARLSIAEEKAGRIDKIERDVAGLASKA